MLNNIKFHFNDLKAGYYSKKVDMALIYANEAEREGDIVLQEYWVDRAEKWLDKEEAAVNALNGVVFE
jgi:hypothetical protein